MMAACGAWCCFVLGGFSLLAGDSPPPCRPLIRVRLRGHAGYAGGVHGRADRVQALPKAIYRGRAPGPR